MYFPMHKHQLQRCVSQSVRLLLSVRWRLSEADMSCKHKSDTSQVGMEARRQEREAEEGMERQQEGRLQLERMTDRRISGRIRTVHRKCFCGVMGA